ncbi:MAG: sulfatase, partial [Thermoprotei archaeon]
ADHGKFLKGPDRMYSELLKVPFMVYYPGCEHRVVDALAWFPDVLPTALEVLGLEAYTRGMIGKSFAEVLTGEREEHRDYVIMGFHEAPDRCVRTKEWSYIHKPGDQPDELYNLVDDPKERINLIDERRDIALKLAAAFGKQFYRESVRVIKGLQAKYELSYTGVQ